MPIHGIDKEPTMKVLTRYGDDTVDLEETDYRHQQYMRNQQTEPRTRYVMQPPGVAAPAIKKADATPVEPDEKLEKAMNEDLRKRGLPKKSKKTN